MHRFPRAWAYNMRELITNFERFLLLRQLKPTTIGEYIKDIELLYFYICKKSTSLSLERISEKELLEFFDDIKINRSKNRAKRWRRSVYEFMNFCVNQGLRGENPMQLIAAQNILEPPKQAQREMVETFLEHLDKDERKSQRDRALIAVLCFTFMPIELICLLTAGDCDLEKRQLTDARGRKYPMNKSLYDVLNKYISKTFYYPPSPTAPLFFGQASNKHIRSDKLRILFRNYLTQFGVDKKIGISSYRGVMADFEKIEESVIEIQHESREYPIADIAGQRFGRLEVMRPSEFRETNHVKWECRCDCGNIVYRSLRVLKNGGNNASCGCLLPEIRSRTFQASNKVVGGTNIALLESNTLYSNNKSGIRGVSYIAKRNKWQVDLHFKGKSHYIGIYSTLEEAAEARAKAVEELHAPCVSDFYATSLPQKHLQ